MPGFIDESVRAQAAHEAERAQAELEAQWAAEVREFKSPANTCRLMDKVREAANARYLQTGFLTLLPVYDDSVTMAVAEDEECRRLLLMYLKAEDRAVVNVQLWFEDDRMGNERQRGGFMIHFANSEGRLPATLPDPSRRRDRA